MSGQGAPGAAPDGRARVLAVAGLLVGAWAVLPPYTGPALNTVARVEFADHVVPSIVVVAISTLVLVGRRARGEPLLFAAGLGVVLAGFWMTVTHLPLVVQATRGEAPWGATVHHSLPGLAVLVVGTVWALAYASQATTRA
jgi:hypothetical protein